jgi:hypothetical protein
MQNPFVFSLAVGIGIILGTVMFAVTDYPAWIAFGIIFGAAIGGAAQRLVPRDWRGRSG